MKALKLSKIPAGCVAGGIKNTFCDFSCIINFCKVQPNPSTLIKIAYSLSLGGTESALCLLLSLTNGTKY